MSSKGGWGGGGEGERGSASHTCTCATKHTHTCFWLLYTDGWKVGGGGSSQVSPTLRVVVGRGAGCAFVGKFTVSTNIARKFSSQEFIS